MSGGPLKWRKQKLNGEKNSGRSVMPGEITSKKRKRKSKISPEQLEMLEIKDTWRRRLLRDIQAARKRARGKVRALEPALNEKKHYQA